MQAVLAWLDVDDGARAASLPALIAAIRMSPTELLRQASDSGLLASAAPQSAHAVRMALTAAVRREQEEEEGLAAAGGGGGRRRLPPPRQSMPKGLLAAGGHDVGWHSQR